MQVLKEEVRTRIYMAAVSEFIKKGYLGASMRGIAWEAGISAGNLYRYYENKERLFDSIVEGVYLAMNKVEETKPSLELLHVDVMEHIDYIVEILLDSNIGTRDALYIILEKSIGSKYEGVKEELIKILEQTILEDILEDSQPEKRIVGNGIFVKALATSAVEGICTIIRESKDDKAFIENIIEYMDFTSKSIVKTLVDMKSNSHNYRRLSGEEIIYSIRNHSDCWNSGH